MALGATQQSPGADRHLMAQVELESRLRSSWAATLPAPRARSISTGAENDLRRRPTWPRAWWPTTG
jgi:hypothetical protein